MQTRAFPFAFREWNIVYYESNNSKSNLYF